MEKSFNLAASKSISTCSAFQEIFSNGNTLAVKFFIRKRMAITGVVTQQELTELEMGKDCLQVIINEALDKAGNLMARQ